jgi:ferritin-like metal-binding protein YciE
LQRLGEALFVERTLASEVLPKLLDEADSEWLAEPLAKHLEQTRLHTQRVEGVFRAAGIEVSSNLSQSLEGIRVQQDELTGKLVEPRLKDIFLAGSAVRIEHLELALYSSLLLLAAALDVDTNALEQNRVEDQHALEQIEQATEKIRDKLPW